MSETNNSAQDRGSRSVTYAGIDRFVADECVHGEDVLAVEEPLELQLLHGPSDRRVVKSISVTMRTPGDDFELAAGFLLGEGLIQDSAEIDAIGYVPYTLSQPDAAPREHPNLVLPYRPDRNVVRVELAADVVVSTANLERNFYTTSSCGICGKASLLALRTVCPVRAPNTMEIGAELLHSLPAQLRASQDVFESTGGLHAAGLFDAEGQLQSVREDVGRHNALDKLIGAEFLGDRTPLRDRILLLSGRASFELLQKALMAGIQVVASVGAPSSLAVTVAKEFDMTLIGFLRDAHFNVYHGANRVKPGKKGRLV